MSYDKNIIAMIYDFDGTLSPQPMQEYTVLPKIGIKPKDFWAEVAAVARQENADEMLTYMRLLIQYAEKNETHISPQDFSDMAQYIEYYPGVKDWFGHINEYVKQKSDDTFQVKHYIISAGMKEILEGISIKQSFEKIYASAYHFNHHNAACFPNVLITGTEKTQYIFRINKGKEHIHESVNDYMPEKDRPIPFSQMIYVGDGSTDVPSMTVTKNNGGCAIAVHKDRNTKQLKKCKELLEAKRVDFIAPADYRTDKPLYRRTQLLLDQIISRMAYEKELWESKRRYRL